ncbi:MAG: hypothetical protein KF904_20750 [Rhodoblastus sp.]|nr:hypothetical protein [Rhodoblastus sp.]
MHNDYSDITSRIAEAPSWFDTNGVPRYGAFTPRALPDIYCDECALVEIACQDCGQRYKVAFSSGQMDRLRNAMRATADLTSIDRRPIATSIKKAEIGYGDPPNCLHKDGCAGATMTSDAVRVLEYWSRFDREAPNQPAKTVGWTRDRSLEIDFPQEQN